jgi:hypothetical protein
MAPAVQPAAEGPVPAEPIVTAALKQPEASAPSPAALLANTSERGERAERGECLTPDKLADNDKDFARNAAELKAPGFCILQVRFKERRRPWTIQTVDSGRPGPLWAVLHDDEDVAFDSAVQGLKTHGGVLFAVHTGGKRNQDGIDPNRNFSDEKISCAKLEKNAAHVSPGLQSADGPGPSDHRAAQQL